MGRHGWLSCHDIDPVNHMTYHSAAGTAPGGMSIPVSRYHRHARRLNTAILGVNDYASGMPAEGTKHILASLSYLAVLELCLPRLRKSGRYAGHGKLSQYIHPVGYI